MASGPIISWQIDEETVTDFIFLGSKITEDGNCSHEIKRHLFLGIKSMTNLDSLLKSRDITLPTQVQLVKAMASCSHVWMWELDHKEGWVLKNWWFWTVVLEKTLESPLDNKEIKPVHPKGNHPEYSLKGLMLKLTFNTLATWCEELTHWNRPWCWKRLKAGGEWDNRGWDGWMASLIPWAWVWASSRSWWWSGKPCMLQFMGM